MRLFAKLALAGAVALLATPALAFTYASSTTMAGGRQFADPDAANSGFLDQQRDAAFGAGGRSGGAALGSLAFGGDDGASDSAPDGARSRIRAPAPAGWGAMPSLSAADLYDDEPPFMPIVVGQPKP